MAGNGTTPDRRPGAAGARGACAGPRNAPAQAPRAPTPRPGHPVHPHQAAIVPAEHGGVNDGGTARAPCRPVSCGTSCACPELFAPTLREDPAEAEIASHRLLLRAGFIRQVMAGVYTILPLGLRTMRKIESDRPRGDGRGRLAGAPDADRPSRRAVEGDRPLRPVRRHAVQADRPSRARADPRPHAGGGRRAAGGRRPPVLPRPAEERLPGRMEVPRRVPAPVRAAPRAASS